MLIMMVRVSRLFFIERSKAKSSFHPRYSHYMRYGYGGRPLPLRTAMKARALECSSGDPHTRVT
ncbi:hypothetical protein HaLaN_08114 [Haematococcus lacustris]|uniref:Uncharacterized protein n=1 Tax=Haematococcus lacustris TaxID=44745 RepID=A0A699Z096_HAELA|nr:hypothetical protein HaLaN_08114 [Haematococcus lacustris]